MKAKVKHLFELISGAVLSLLGFSSCNTFVEIIEPRAEYGMPHATFKIIGEVKAADSGKPVEGIVVKFSRGSEEPSWEEGTFNSDKDGKVDGSLQAWPSDKDIMLTFEDVDGPENGGQFARDTLRASDLKIEFVEDKKSSWHRGVYTITFEEKLKKAE